jgi:hypothetical protein
VFDKLAQGFLAENVASMPAPRTPPAPHVHSDGGVAPRKFTTLVVYRCTGSSSYPPLVTFEVTFRDHSVEVVEGADAYQPEGPMTTFFADGAGRQTLGPWSTRLASYRTSEILIVRRQEHEGQVNVRTASLRSA